MGRKLVRSASLRLAGNLAIVLGVLLAVAAVGVGENGWTVLVIPSAEAVGVLALVFTLGGWGIRRGLPGASPAVAVGYLYVGSCQILAAAEVSSWRTGLAHALFAVWLWGEALVLGFQSRALR